jgi:hypothetical protein
VHQLEVSRLGERRRGQASCWNSPLRLARRGSRAAAPAARGGRRRGRGDRSRDG